MEHDFKDTKYFKYLFENLDKLESERLDFNNKILLLLNSKTDELGLVLKCHLIIEHYIDEFLIAAYPTVNNWSTLRLTFSQKIDLIDTPNTIMKMAYSSIKCLNSLRNKFSHRLAYKIKDEDYREIKDILTIWYKAAGEPVPEGIKILEKYTVWICAILNGMIIGIKKETPELGLSGYLDWLNKMTKSEK